MENKDFHSIYQLYRESRAQLGQGVVPAGPFFDDESESYNEPWSQNEAASDQLSNEPQKRYTVKAEKINTGDEYRYNIIITDNKTGKIIHEDDYVLNPDRAAKFALASKGIEESEVSYEGSF